MAPRTNAQPQPSAAAAHAPGLRIGLDLGGTKIEGIVLAPDGAEVARKRVPSPRGDYVATLAALTSLVADLETRVQQTHLPVGIGIPGSLSPSTGKVRNANSTWLNGQDLNTDLDNRLGRHVAIANDANCFALSEATDGAGADQQTVIGIILGTGVGSGIVINGTILNGPLGIAGEWGHNRLYDPQNFAAAMPPPQPGSPDAQRAERTSKKKRAPLCWCGRRGCVESYLSGPALERQYAEATGVKLSVSEIVQRAQDVERMAMAILARHAGRLAAGLTSLVNTLDPDVIVLGGGLSHMTHLYETLPAIVSHQVFADHAVVQIRPPRWGDASGVRGAAWLNPLA